jgi:hypothetical protein
MILVDSRAPPQILTIKITVHLKQCSRKYPYPAGISSSQRNYIFENEGIRKPLTLTTQNARGSLLTSRHLQRHRNRCLPLHLVIASPPLCWLLSPYRGSRHPTTLDKPANIAPMNTSSSTDTLEPTAIDPNCDWCGGTGQWTDPDGKKWPCIKCNR